MKNWKSILLATGSFIDNEYLDLYTALISATPKTVSYMEKHHIIPVAYYKQKHNIDTPNYRHRAEQYANTDPDNTIVLLSFADHCRAHWLLTKCTLGNLAMANASAFFRMIGALKYIDEKVFLQQKSRIIEVGLTAKEYDLLQQQKLEVKASTNNSYWSAEQDEWLRQNRHTYSARECAKILGRTEKAILCRCTILGLPKKVWYTEEEIKEFLGYSKTHTAKECAEYFGTSEHNVIKRWRDLGFSKTFKWDVEKDNWLRENDSKYTVAELAEKLGTTKTTIMGRRWTLGITRWDRAKK